MTGGNKQINLFCSLTIILCFLSYVATAQKSKPDRTTPPEMGNGIHPPPADRSTWSQGFGQWKPMFAGECSTELHNKYWVRGPDGKIYHTWHPTSAMENGKRCYFGHEHGDDPSTSTSFRNEPIPFGYLNSVLGYNRRHEDHVGHKIALMNDAQGIRYSDKKVLQTCDTLMKVHMGTHSNDAFVNSAHEVFLYANCDNGRYFKLKFMHIFGKYGEFRSTDSCQINYGVQVNTALYPRDSLQHDIKAPVNYMAGRGIPYRQCVEEKLLQPPPTYSPVEVLADEHWRMQVVFNWTEGKIQFDLNPYLHVYDPIRYFDPNNKNTNPNARPPLYSAYFVDLCYLNGSKQLNHWLCDKLKKNPKQRVAWNSVESPFKGIRRAFAPNSLAFVVNRGQQTTFWTDAYLQNPSFNRPAPNDRERIEQYVKGISGGELGDLGTDRTIKRYPDNGVHAPN